MRINMQQPITSCVLLSRLIVPILVSFFSIDDDNNNTIYDDKLYQLDALVSSYCCERLCVLIHLLYSSITVDLLVILLVMLYYMLLL